VVNAPPPLGGEDERTVAVLPAQLSAAPAPRPRSAFARRHGARRDVVLLDHPANANDKLQAAISA